jgi:pSer/pThr/pTyr-binding forkhead associated (FHA) protein
MTTTALAATTARSQRGEPATAPIELDRQPLLHALPFLDHRSARRTVERGTATPGHYLALEDGETEALYPLGDGVTHVGRSLASELRFEHPQVSRRHAIIARYGHHVRALDDRSSAGTFVNGTRVVAVELLDGDVLRIGPLVLRCVRVR